MGHGHNHHVDPEAGDRRVFAAIAVNMGLTVAQIVGGVISGSLALIADALHNFSDAISLIIAFGAREAVGVPTGVCIRASAYGAEAALQPTGTNCRSAAPPIGRSRRLRCPNRLASGDPRLRRRRARR